MSETWERGEHPAQAEVHEPLEEERPAVTRYEKAVEEAIEAGWPEEQEAALDEAWDEWLGLQKEKARQHAWNGRVVGVAWCEKCGKTLPAFHRLSRHDDCRWGTPEASDLIGSQKAWELYLEEAWTDPTSRAAKKALTRYRRALMRPKTVTS